MVGFYQAISQTGERLGLLTMVFIGKHPALLWGSHQQPRNGGTATPAGLRTLFCAVGIACLLFASVMRCYTSAPSHICIAPPPRFLRIERDVIGHSGATRVAVVDRTELAPFSSAPPVDPILRLVIPV